jgi:AraC-like DNA-binding protein
MFNNGQLWRLHDGRAEAIALAQWPQWRDLSPSYFARLQDGHFAIGFRRGPLWIIDAAGRALEQGDTANESIDSLDSQVHALQYRSRYFRQIWNDTMKTSFDIDDALLERARRRARQDQLTLKQIIENGLRLALKEPKANAAAVAFKWPVAVGALTQPLTTLSVNQAIAELNDSSELFKSAAVGSDRR